MTILSFKRLAILIEAVLNFILPRNYFLYPFPVIFILGTAVSLSLHLQNHDSFARTGLYSGDENDSSSQPVQAILNPKNLFNVIFANHGVFWYSFYFWVIAFCHLYIRKRLRVPQYPISNNSSSQLNISQDVSASLGTENDQLTGVIQVDETNVLRECTTSELVASSFLRYITIIVTWTSLFAWCFGDSITTRIAHLFKINVSGHFMFLSSASMSLLFELKLLLQQVHQTFDFTEGLITKVTTFLILYDKLRFMIHTLNYKNVTVEEMEDIANGNNSSNQNSEKTGHNTSDWFLVFFYWLQAAILVTTLLWLVLFTVTSIFFHTILEKFIGLVLSYSLIWVVYLYADYFSIQHV